MQADRPVREIMTTRVVTVTPDATADMVKEIFRKNNFHHIPVIDQTTDALLGIISMEDFFKQAYLLSLDTGGKRYSEKAYESLRARDFMTEDPLFIEPDDTIGLAADIFLANQFHALPIVDEGKLVGIITTHDLLSFVFNSNYVEKGD
jgi:acetoin utilization protein AcuB